MTFLNIPVKSITVIVSGILGSASAPWEPVSSYPVGPGQPTPTPIQRDYRWQITMTVESQAQSSYLTRAPGSYNGQDINIGDWVANLITGEAWQVVEIKSKNETEVVAIIEDINRYNTYRATAKNGNGSPIGGNYVVFNLSEDGLPEIDPVPAAGISGQFTQNLSGRFGYISKQYNYSLYQEGNTFAVGDVVATNPITRDIELASDTATQVIGTVTSVSNISSGWFTVNPVQKIVDNFDSLPGLVGDIIYTDLVNPGQLTLDTGGTPVYVKIRNNSQTTTTGTGIGPTASGSVFQINGTNITVGGSGDIAAAVAAINAATGQTGVSAETALAPTSVQTNPALISTTYGEPALYAESSPAISTINGVSVTFNIPDPNYFGYARPPQMAESINAANIPNILATTINGGSTLVLTNTAGGAINIVNQQSDSGGVAFAGTSSGSGLALNTPASTTAVIKCIAIDARPIGFLDVSGSAVTDFGLQSSGGGIRAAALFMEKTPGQEGGGGSGVQVFFDASMTFPLTIATIPAGSVVSNVNLMIFEPFDGTTPTASVGDSTNNQRLLATADSLISSVGSYSAIPAHLYTDDTVVSLYVSTGASTNGSGAVLIQFQ